MIGFYFRRFNLIPKQIRLLSTYLIGYILVILLFLGFIYVNGSIVVGDKSAHEAAVNLPQVNQCFKQKNFACKRLKKKNALF